MNTKLWGPSAWVTVHAFAFGYPLDPTPIQKDQYKKFYTDMQYTLPCSYCRQSYGEFLKVLPIDNYLETRLQLAYWTYLVHDMVNKKLSKQSGKKIKSPPFIKIVNKYEKMRAKPKKHLKARHR